jgi:predicted nucleic acid-binding protein
MLRLNGFLLDTNHLCGYFARDARFLARLESQVPERRIFWVSAISLGEIEAGYLTTKHDVTVENRFRSFIAKEFVIRPERNFVLPIDENSRQDYGEIVGRILNKHPGRNPKEATEAFLNGLGVDINDVWIFATARKHNLTLLTSDKMDAIRDVVPDTEVKVDNWL